MVANPDMIMVEGKISFTLNGESMPELMSLPTSWADKSSTRKQVFTIRVVLHMLHTPVSRLTTVVCGIRSSRGFEHVGTSLYIVVHGPVCRIMMKGLMRL